MWQTHRQTGTAWRHGRAYAQHRAAKRFKIAIFDQYLALSRKRHTIGPSDKNSCAIYGMVPFRMTLSDLPKYSLTLSIARPVCDSWPACTDIDDKHWNYKQFYSFHRAPKPTDTVRTICCSLLLLRIDAACSSVRSSVSLCVAIMRTEKKRKQFTAVDSTDDLYEIINAVWHAAAFVSSPIHYTLLPRDAMHSANYAVARCLSVSLPSHPGILSKRIDIFSSIFHH